MRSPIAGLLAVAAILVAVSAPLVAWLMFAGAALIELIFMVVRAALAAAAAKTAGDVATSVLALRPPNPEDGE